MSPIGGIWKLSRDIAILVSTAPRYVKLAHWTIGRIKDFWPEHPKIHICGAEGMNGSLRLRDDPRDWMRVTASACEDLLGAGFKKALLILDDHPPIARCNAGFLLGEMPRMLDEMDATSCLAVGPGPVLKTKGDFNKIGAHFFEKLPLSEPWKLVLHPALWNIERLHGILRHLIDFLPDSQHNPWAFERIGSSATEGGVNKEWLESCWRVDGWGASTAEARRLHDFRDVCQRVVLRSATIAMRPFGNAAEAFKSRVAFLWQPRIGAYPCFWSGVMKKGGINRDYLFYAEFKNRPDLAIGLTDVFREVEA